MPTFPRHLRHRWSPANLLVLRMLSYSLDRHRDKQRAAAAAAAASEPAAATAAATAAAAERHSLAVYVAYVFYPPLYLAGPIVTYDDFEAQWAFPSSSSLSSLSSSLSSPSSSLSSSPEEPATAAIAAAATTTAAAAAAAAAPATTDATESPPLAAAIARPDAEATARAAAASGLSPLSTAYVLRLLGAWLLLELLTRYFYGFALSRRGHAPRRRGTASAHDSLRLQLRPAPTPTPPPPSAGRARIEDWRRCRSASSPTGSSS